MAGTGPTPTDESTTTPTRRRSVLFLMLGAVLCVIVPFIFWYNIWFGRPLSDQQIGHYLSEEQNPRKIQHALSQIADRVVQGDPSVKQWYPLLTTLVDHPHTEVRLTVAWVMGQDNHSEAFHKALLQLVEDPQVMVRRNAALALARFADTRARRELVGILEPYRIHCPHPGTVSTQLEIDQPVGPGTLLARIVDGNDEVTEVRSPIAGQVASLMVRDGSRVEEGDELVRLTSAAKQVLAALQGLYLVGDAEDLPAIEKYSLSRSEVPDDIRRQARLTAEAIRTRTGRPSTR